MLYISSVKDLKDNKIKTEYKKIKSKYSRRSKNPYRVKKANFVIGHINGLILDEEEKLIKYIRSSFLKKYLLGDIVINNKQESILNEYLNKELIRFDQNPDSFEPLSETLFAVSFVRFAMNNYNKKPGAFWPYFKEEYGVDIKPNKQTYLNDIFKDIMMKYKKKYFEN